MGLIERIDRWADRTPDRIAHRSGERALTWRDLVRSSNRLAWHLARTLPQRSSPVAVLGHKEPEMLVAFLGAVKAGHPYVPIDTALPPHRIDRIMAASGASVTLTPAQVATILDEVAADPPAEPIDPLHRVGESEPYYIIFTSGSTGEPKGVVITLGCLESFVDWMLAEQNLGDAGGTFLNQAPFSFDLSVMDLYLALATGGTLFSVTRDEIADPRRLFASFPTSGLSVWVSTASFAQMCLAERTFSQQMLPELRLFLFCGEVLSPEVASGLLDRFPGAAVWNTYGPTEATVATTSVRIDRDVLARYSPLPVGRVKPGTRILLLNQDAQPVAPGERGEVVIAGPNVSPGYLGRPDLTERAFFRLDGERAYRTGDRGRFEGDLLFFEGRMDNQIKLHGHRIELGDVESNLRALPGVSDAVVLPLLKRGKAEALAAFVVLRERSSGSDFALAVRLRQALAERVPGYMVPQKIVFLETFPMTSNGKADRAKLAERLV
jgi:D-alanine--poly(phosphoribitol) ligase subunit 1